MELEAPPKPPLRRRRRKKSKSLRKQFSDTILQTVVEEEEFAISKSNSNECLIVPEEVEPSTAFLESLGGASVSASVSKSRPNLSDDTNAKPFIKEPQSQPTQPTEPTEPMLSPGLLGDNKIIVLEHEIPQSVIDSENVLESSEESAPPSSISESIKEQPAHVASLPDVTSEDVEDTPILVMKLEDRIQPDDQSVLDMDMAIFQDVRLSSSTYSKQPADSLQQLTRRQETPSTSARSRDIVELSKLFGIPISYPPTTIQGPIPQKPSQPSAIHPEQVNQVLAHIPPFQTKFKNSSYLAYHRRKAAEKNNNSHEKVPLQTSWNDLAEEYGLNTNIDEEAGIMIEYYQMTLRENLLPTRIPLTPGSSSFTGPRPSRHKRASQVTLNEGPLNESPASPSMKNLYSGTSLLRRNERSKLYTINTRNPPLQPLQEHYYQHPYSQGQGYIPPSPNVQTYPAHPGSPKQRPKSNTYISLAIDPKTNALTSDALPSPPISPEEKKAQQFEWVTKLRVKTRTALNRARSSFRSIFRKDKPPAMNGKSNAPSPVSGATSPVPPPPPPSTNLPTFIIPSDINKAMLQAVNKFESIADVDYKRLQAF